MTSSTTTIKAVSDGDGTTASVQRPRHRAWPPCVATRPRASSAWSARPTARRRQVAHDLFDAIYDRDSSQSTAAQLQDRLCEALTCLETTDHYLRMLGSVLDERADTAGTSTEHDGDPEDPGEPPF